MVLGEGGMGRVYLAEDQKLSGRRVAIKMMGANINSDAEFRARFAREAVLQANLPHPQIVQILDIGECPEGSYIVMEYSAGRSLSRLVKE
jgi:serine/threonine-protein kinase